MAAAEVFANSPVTSVTSGGTDAPAPGTSQSWTVQSSSSFPAASTGSTQFHVVDTVLPSEIILVTNVSGTTWTVTRGAESTTPVAHTAGFTVFQVVTAAFLNSVAPNNGGLFGSGSDGTVTFDGTTTILGLVPSANVYTMTRDIQCTSITINNGVTVKTANFRIYCQGTVTNNGTISNTGASASAGTAGGAGGASSFIGGRAGGNGGTGTSGTGANGSNANFGVAGGAGGAGTSGAAGTGGTITVGTAVATANVFGVPYPLLSGITAVAGTSQVPGWGAGGGGGGSDASSNAGGGGGAGGGIVAIFAQAVNNGSGTITVAGGNGANGTGGNAGGGGGGSGGLIAAYTLSAWTAGTTTVTGGTKGAKAGTGSDGSNGGNGTVLNVVVA